MRILHVTPTYLPATRYGGPIYSVHGLARAQAARGDAAHVFTTNVDGAGETGTILGAPVDLDGVHVSYFPCAFGRRVYRSPDMARALRVRAQEFDVLHIHSVYLWPTSAAAKIAYQLDLPYILSPRGMLNPELIRAKSRIAKSLWIRFLGHDIIARAGSIHVTSGIEAEDIRRLGLPARRIDLVSNGVDVPPRPTTPEGGRSFVLSLGRISWKKGIDQLIRAFAHVSGANLVIAGNDDEGLTPRLRALAEELGLAHRVTFIGPVQDDQKWNLLRAASIVALASRSENFANVVLEAMACGTPVVITPSVGLASTVARVGAGIVVEAEPPKFGAALAALLSDPVKRENFGAAGKRAALAEFSWPAVADQMNLVYQRALAV